MEIMNIYYLFCQVIVKRGVFKMELYVVRCYMQGCEECGNEYHIVGVFSTKEKAQEVEKQHNKYKHLHSYNTNIDKIILDEFRKSYGEE